MPDKGGLQLLPETRRKIEVRIPGENRLIYIGGVLIALVMIVYGGLWLYINTTQNKIASADEQLLALEAQRNKKEEESLLTLSKQIAATAQVVKNHTYWSTGLGKIEAALQPKVQFRSISAVVSDGTFRMRAQTDSYVTLAKQLAAFVADDSIKDITLEGVNVMTNGKLDFSAKIDFDLSKFLKSP